jgi:hypothetical protein
LPKTDDLLLPKIDDAKLLVTIVGSKLATAGFLSRGRNGKRSWIMAIPATAWIGRLKEKEYY